MNKQIEKRDVVLWVLVFLLILGLIMQSASLWKTKKELRALQSAQTETHSGHYYPGHSRHGQRYAAPAAAFQAWDPFLEMELMQQRINNLFRHSMNRVMAGPVADFSQMSEFEPNADMKQTETEYIVKMDLPGMEKDKINVEVKDQWLTVSGERKTESEQKDKGFYRSELSYGSFSRTIPLPGDVNPEKVTAEYNNGVLTVRLDKMNPGKTAGPVSKVAVN